MPPAEPSNRKIRVLVVDDIPETRENVRKLLFFEDDIEIIGTASNGREGVELASKLLPDIVLMDINMPEMDGITASETIAAKHPEVQVVMMSVQGEADYLRRSMLAGAREFLIKPFSGDELSKSIRRVYQLGAARRAMAPPVSASPTPAAPPPKGGEIIVVFGAKGGCGTTTLAINLAVALREETKAKVAILDANFELGDVGVMLNLPNQHTIADLTGPKVVIDEELVHGVMASHGSGVKAMLAPARPEMAELVTLERVKTLLDLLPKMFDYIVIDLWRTFQEPVMTIIDKADRIVLVTTSDIPSIKNAKLFFELSNALAYPSDKILLVLNREDGRSSIGVKDIEASIKHPVTAVLPRDDRNALLALNRGTPFITAARTIPLTVAVRALARSLCRENAKEAGPVPAARLAPAKLKWFSHR